MHKEVLKSEQIGILSLLKLFNKDFYLVDGTAIALHIGHRFSLDFDLFTHNNLKRKNIKNILEKQGFHIERILYEDSIQLHSIINGVKLTFYQFPYKLETPVIFENYIKLPDLLTLSAMKAFALGGRGKWKDYVDMYFIFKDHFSMQEVCLKAKSLFHESFNEKLFRQQLAYFEDISFEEEVEYVGNPVSENEIKDFLTEVSLTPF